MKKIGYLSLLTLFLFGCGAKESSPISSEISSSSLFESSSTVEESSSSPEGPISYDLTTKMLTDLSEGYRAEGLYTAVVKDQIVSSFYYEYNCTDTVYEYTAYADNPSNPTKDKVEDSYRYEGYDVAGDGTKYLTLAKLNLNNEVVNYLVSDGVSYLKWDSTGFANVFTQAKSSHFENSETDFEFDLRMGLTSLRGLYASFTSQFSSYMGLTAESFTLITDGYKAIGYRMTYAPLAATGGMMYITCEGKFTKIGSDVVKPIEPFDGETNEVFDDAIDSLREHTYRIDIDLGIKSYKMVVAKGTSLIYDEFDDKGRKVSSYGFNTIQEGVLQGITEINDVIYADGPYGLGSLEKDILPTLNLSSELFVLVEETQEKSVFKYNEEAPSIQEIGFNYDYGIFGGSKIGDLTITVLENEVIVENKLKYNTETFRYYDINKVGRYFNDIKTNSDGLKWSEILSNQEAESQKLYNAIPQEVMDLIPTVGGINARVDLDASYKPNEPVIKVPTYIGGANLDQLYSEKLIASGFELNETLSTDGKKAYTKACEVNGVAKTLVVKTFLAEDVLSGSQFLIYPSLI